MIGAVVRVLFGFAVACLAAGATQVLFAIPPTELQDAPEERLWQVGDWILLAATQSAVFAAPFALLTAAFAEWQGVRSFLYYVLTGFVISAAGFMALYVGEGADDPTILNSYALAAYVVTGLVAGFVYWMFAGRFTARDDEPEPYGEAAPQRGEPAPQPAPAAPSQGSHASKEKPTPHGEQTVATPVVTGPKTTATAVPRTVTGGGIRPVSMKRT